MWKANIQSVATDQTASIANVTIKYINDDGRTKTVTERVSEPSAVAKIASDGLRELNRIDTITEFISNPVLGEVDFALPTPTQEELDKQTYQQKRQELISLKQDLDLGLIDQTTYDTFLATLKK